MTDQPALLPDEALLKSLEAAASKGEWTTHSQFGQIVDANGRSIGSVSFFGHGEEQAESNRAFVVAARNMVPVLLSRLAEARAEVERWKAAVTDRRRERRIANSQRRTAYHEARKEWVSFKREDVHDHIRRVCLERDALKALLPEDVWREALGIKAAPPGDAGAAGEGE